MKLSDKITSFEEYQTVELPKGNGLMRDMMTQSRTCLSLHQGVFVPRYATEEGGYSDSHASWLPPNLWWLHREIMRQHYGVYDPATAPLKQLQHSMIFGQYMPHISRDDPTLIAFTMSAEDGVRDKQTRVSLGRFIRKFTPVMSDPHIAALESTHRSELNPDVTLHSFETDFKTCLKVYMAINSCMSKAVSSFNSDVHPLQAYNAPGWHLAELKNASGGSSARSIVWINPEDSNDKRMVRVYGDAALGAWLKRNGFAEKSFEGAYLYTHVVPGISDGGGGLKPILMPYVDAGSNVNGGGRSEREMNGYGVWDGANRVYLISHHSYSNKYKDKACTAQSTSGYVHARPFPINGVSIVSGKKFNAMSTSYETVWVDGKTGFAPVSELGEYTHAFVDGAVQAYIHVSTPTFVNSGRKYLESDAQRAYTGFKRLSAKFYPDDQTWVKLTGDMTVTADGDYIKIADKVSLIGPDKVARILHISELPKTAIRVASLGDVKTWAASVDMCVRTTTNRQVVPGVHPVVQLHDSTWTYERHAASVVMFGTTVWYEKDKPVPTVGMPAAVIQRISTICAVSASADKALAKSLFTLLNDRGDVLVPYDASKTKTAWSYVFQHDDINMPIVRKFLAADYNAASNDGATQEATARFHALGNMIADAVDVAWAQKPASVQEPVAA